MNEEDITLLKSYCTERSIKRLTYHGYKDAFNKFTSFINDSLTHRLKIYEKEEENIPWKKRTMKQDLISFQKYLLDNFLFSTAKVHFTRICTFLRHYDFEVHNLPRMNSKNAKMGAPIYHSDLLTREEITRAVRECNHEGLKCLILFCCTTGCGRAEALNLTVQDYLFANNVPFTSETDIKKAIRSVDCSSVPTFRLRRIKTNKHYFTFCTPQVNHMIKFYLLTRKFESNLNLYSPLFKINLDYVNKKLHKLNDELGFGKAGQYNRLRMHMFRKYHASTLYNHGMRIQDVDSLQGRGKDSTHSAYFMEDPNKTEREICEIHRCTNNIKGG